MTDVRWTFQHENRYTAFDGRLYLERRPEKSPNWSCRCCINGKLVPKSTRTPILADAKTFAEDWFDELRFRVKRGEPISEPTFRKAYDGFIAREENDRLKTGASNKAKIRNYKSLWNGTEAFLGDVPLSRITGEKLEEFRRWRIAESEKRETGPHRHCTLSEKTLKNYQILISRVLKYAVSHSDTYGLKALPPFPETHVEHDKPEWFTQDETDLLLTTAARRCDLKKLCKNNAGTAIWRDRRELLAFAWLVLHACIRVSECLRLRWRDLIPHKDNKRVARDRQQVLIEVNWVRRGKTGHRQGIGTVGVVIAMGILRELYPDAKRDDYLFPSPKYPGRHRASFKKSMKSLLKATKPSLYLDAKGKKRNAKTLRHTSIMLRFIYEPDIRPQELSVISGVSQATLEKYYLSHLTGYHVSQRLMRKALEREYAEYLPSPRRRSPALRREGLTARQISSHGSVTGELSGAR